MFLTEEDFDTVIDSDQLNKIVGNNPDLLSGAIMVAVAEITGYLSNRYDVAVAFSTVGAARNPFLVQLCADMALYHLYSRIAAKNMPEQRGIRYADATGWLKMANAGKVSLNLPIKPIDNQTGYFLFGGNKPFNVR